MFTSRTLPVLSGMLVLLVFSFFWIDAVPTYGAETGQFLVPDTIADCNNSTQPTVVQPLDGAQLSTIAPAFQWNPPVDVQEERMQLSTSPDFGIGTVMSSLFHRPNTGIQTLRLSDNLIPDTTYYWKIASVCSSQPGPYSTVYSFRTAAAGGILPNQPRPSTPSNGVTTLWAYAPFVFDRDLEATEYQVRKYSSLTNAQMNQAWNGCTGTLKTSPISCFSSSYGQTQFWRVQQRNAYGWSEISAQIESFRTPTQTVSTTISAQNGGQLTTDGGAVHIEIPAGVLTDTTVLTASLQKTAATTAPPFPYRFVAGYFQLQASTQEGAPDLFQQPYTMTVQLSADLLSSFGLESVESINMLFYNGQIWRPLFPCSECSVDVPNHQLRIRFNKAGDFLLAVLLDKSVYLPFVMSN